MIANVLTSLHREVLPPLTMVAGTAASAFVFMISASYTLEQVSAAARASSVRSSLKPSFATQLDIVEAPHLDIARATPVIVDMVSKASAGQVISVTGSHTHTVGVESLRVRSAPKRTAHQVGALAGGAKVTVTLERNGWLYLTAGDGTNGWAYHAFLRPAL
jgi:hypothetical protein